MVFLTDEATEMGTLIASNVQASRFSDKTLSVYHLTAEDQLLVKVTGEGGINETKILAETLEKVCMGSMYFLLPSYVLIGPHTHLLLYKILHVQ